MELYWNTHTYNCVVFHSWRLRPTPLERNSLHVSQYVHSYSREYMSHVFRVFLDFRLCRQLDFNSEILCIYVHHFSYIRVAFVHLTWLRLDHVHHCETPYSRNTTVAERTTRIIATDCATWRVYLLLMPFSCSAPVLLCANFPVERETEYK